LFIIFNFENDIRILFVGSLLNHSMRYFLGTLALFIVLFANAQRQSVEIHWEASKNWSNNASVFRVPSDKENKIILDVDSQNVVFEHLWRVSSSVDKNDFVLTNVISAPVSDQELYDLKSSSLFSEFKWNLFVTSSRDQTIAGIHCYPIFVENGVVKRVTSFIISQKNTKSKSQAQNVESLFSQRSNSVLSSGEWFQFSISKSGVYKLDRSFLSKLGMNVNSMNPKNLKIYGNGGRMIPFMNKNVEGYDVIENPILVVGEEDNSFDNEDYILFYAEGPDQWNEESQTHLNLFTTQITYYITASESAGKRIITTSQPSNTPSQTFQNGTVRLFHEEDLFNIGNFGRRWFGQPLSFDPERTLEFEMPGIQSGSEATLEVKPVAVASSPTSMNVQVLSKQLSFNFSASSEEVVYAQDNSNPLGGVQTRGAKRMTIAPSSEKVDVEISFENGGNPASEGYIDYVRLEYQRALAGANHQYVFMSNLEDQLGTVMFTFSNSESIPAVWDVTDRFQIMMYPNEASESSFSFKTLGGIQRKFVALSVNDYFIPDFHQNSNRVTNQNLKGTVFDFQGSESDVDYLIITNKNLESEANRLAEFHNSFSKLNTKVVTIESIYTEFNTGNPDIGAIRNFIKYVYDNASASSTRLKYLCLFGDTSFDYQNRIRFNNNIVPTYYSYNSYSAVNSFMSDDFYAMMDPEEGSLSFADRMDIAVGRIVADDRASAKSAVDKIIRYHDKSNYGSWRNSFLLISDDVDKSWETTIQENIDWLGDVLYEKKPFINVKKIHSDAYVQEASAAGDRYPAVNTLIKNDLNLGALVFNYFGHGGEDGLASERIFDKLDATNLYNPNKLPLFITSTCEFSRFDNPLRETAGELTFSNPNGGAIGLISTTRQILVINGISYNNILTKHLFSYDSENYVTVGEALRLAKAEFSGTAQKRILFYIGDPALKLAIPKPKIVLTHVNDIPIDQAVDTLKALSKINFKGKVTDVSNNLLSSYEGIATVTVFDKEIEKKTLRNDNVGDALEFRALGKTIFKGKASVKEGLFDIDFIVPKDIAIPIGNARISLYAKDNTSYEDQSGYTMDLLIGGLSDTIGTDTQGPEIKLFMNDTSFVYGGITNESPILIAELYDENGINTAGGIGHDITAILDGDETNPIVLNDYYEANIDTYQTGKLQYSLRNLSPGLHTLTLKAWDVYNNSSSAEIQFLVLDDGNLVLDRVLNYPNPFTSYTEFWFQHNKPFEPLDVRVQVFTVSGKMVWSTVQTITTDGFLSRDITWDGRDQFGGFLGKGVYVYKISVKLTLTNKIAEKFEKLVILK